ncbi:MAG: hypothetical protein ABIK68_23080 [bacterium]
MRKPFFKSGIIGILVIITSLMLLKVFPSQAPRLPDGFFTPILAFEFVRTQEEVQALFGAPGSDFRAAMITAMDLGNRLDYVYMVLYAAFLFGFSMTCARITRHRQYYIAALLAILVLIGDALENVQLLGITQKLANGGFERELELLVAFTWLKWGGLALIFLILVPYFFSGGLAGKMIALVGLTAVVLAVLSFFRRSAFNELYAISVAVMFLLMIIFSLTHRRRNRILL